MISFGQPETMRLSEKGTVTCSMRCRALCSEISISLLSWALQGEARAMAELYFPRVAACHQVDPAQSPKCSSQKSLFILGQFFTVTVAFVPNLMLLNFISHSEIIWS